MVSASIRSNFDEWMENRYSFRFYLDFSKLEEINLKKRITFSIRSIPTNSKITKIFYQREH